MSTVTLEEAQAHLAELIERLQPGEELVITRNATPIAGLVSKAEPPPAKRRRSGTLKGTVLYMAPDFNEPLEEFKEYMK